jgi:3-hydroxyisobutyrate dehydrogenase
MPEKRIAILGLGIMGSGMAGRLLTTGFSLAVYNRTREKCRVFADAGAIVANTPREAAAGAEIILSMVGDDAASREIWLGENGALNGARPGSILIESSTLSEGWVHDLAAAAAKRACRFLDAPVTGTKPHAAAGELLFLVGGDAETLEAARPAFSAMGREVIHLGPVGSGALMKLVNNFVCGVQAASFAEALSLIDAGGINRRQAVAVLTSGAPGSGIVKRMAERSAANDFTPNFLLRWMAKDLSYALAESSSVKVSLQTAVAALSVFQHAIAAGYGDEDFSAVVKISSLPASL